MANEILKPLQPAFSAYTPSQIANATGDGTAAGIGATTEQFDQSADYTAASSTYTAPITGKHFFTACVYYYNLGAGHTFAEVEFLSPGGVVEHGNAVHGANCRTAANTLALVASRFISLDAGDTIYVRAYVSGSTKTVGIDFDASGPRTTFQGWLVC